MKALIQRVRQARVEVDGETVGDIGVGLLVLVCAEHEDTEAQADKLVTRLLKLRVFSDEGGKMNRDLLDLQAAHEADPSRPVPGLLVVSQFTLAADTRSGHRPSFTGAAPAAQGRALYERVLDQARAQFPRVAAGVFGADMQVHLINDGPVTIPMTV